MKAHTLSLLVGLFSLKTIVNAQEKRFEYTIKRNGAVVGNIHFTHGIAGNRTVLTMESEVNTRFIFNFKAKVKEETIYDKGIMTWSSIFRKLNGNVKVDKKKEVFGKTDLEHLFRQAKEAEDEKQPLNTEFFENALELPKIRIRQSLVPRKEIVGIDIKESIDALRRVLIETKLSRIVVFEGNIDHIIGYVHQLDMFKRPATIQSVLLPIPAVPESMSATDLINKFTRERKSIAWVVDEFGGTAGIITMEDVLEEIFGEIQDEYDVEEFVEKQIAEHEYIFSGRLELDYINEKYGFDFPVDETETLSGFIINYHETIPKQKERIIIADYEFDIMNVSDTRIEMVKVKKLK